MAYSFGAATFHLGKLADIIEMRDARHGVAVDAAGVAIATGRVVGGFFSVSASGLAGHHDDAWGGGPMFAGQTIVMPAANRR